MLRLLLYPRYSNHTCAKIQICSTHGKSKQKFLLAHKKFVPFLFPMSSRHPYFRYVATPLGLMALCMHPTIHDLRISHHDKGVWHIHKMLVTNARTRCWNLVNATSNPNCFPQQKVPSWLYPCFWTFPMPIIMMQNYKTYDPPPPNYLWQMSE